MEAAGSPKGLPHAGDDIRRRTFRFACRVVALCKTLESAPGVGRVLAPQLVSCSTSVAAMLEEARAAESRRDFISKCAVGLKECREAHVRLRICRESQLGPAAETDALCQEANELISIVTAIIRNTRRNAPRP
jgi:four helix bundle protein